MPNVYLKKELYDWLIKEGYDPQKIIEKLVRDFLSNREHSGESQ